MFEIWIFIWASKSRLIMVRLIIRQLESKVFCFVFFSEGPTRRNQVLTWHTTSIQAKWREQNWVIVWMESANQKKKRVICFDFAWWWGGRDIEEEEDNTFFLYVEIDRCSIHTVDVENADVVVTVVLRLSLVLTETDHFVGGWPTRFFQQSQSVQTQAK